MINPAFSGLNPPCSSNFTVALKNQHGPGPRPRAPGLRKRKRDQPRWSCYRWTGWSFGLPKSRARESPRASFGFWRIKNTNLRWWYPGYPHDWKGNLVWNLKDLKRMVETCWNPMNHGMFTTYQLVQDFFHFFHPPYDSYGDEINYPSQKGEPVGATAEVSHMTVIGIS